MDLRPLQVCHTVMETRSASLAARMLGVSQPAVSTLLKRLEERLGIALLARARNRLEPTPETVLLMEHVSHALESITKVRNGVDDIQHADAGMLAVAANPTSSAFLLHSSWRPYASVDPHPATSRSPEPLT